MSKTQDYKYVHDSRLQDEQTVAAYADTHHGGVFTIQRIPQGFVGCYGSAIGLFTTRAYRNGNHMPCYEGVLAAMACVPCMYIPELVEVTIEEYCDNSSLSQIELHAAAFYDGRWMVERRDDGQYVGAYGNTQLATSEQRENWQPMPDLSTLYFAMATDPGNYGINGWPADG